MKTKGLLINYEDSKGNWLGNFNDIFKWVPKEAQELPWSILNLQVNELHLDELDNQKLPLKEFQSETVRLFEDKISKSPIGLMLTWEQLNYLAGNIHQIIDGIFIACKELKNTRQYHDDDGIQSIDQEQEMYESCDYVIHMFDASYWIIFTKDQKLYDTLVQNFEIARYLDSENFL